MLKTRQRGNRPVSLRSRAWLDLYQSFLPKSSEGQSFTCLQYFWMHDQDDTLPWRRIMACFSGKRRYPLVEELPARSAPMRMNTTISVTFCAVRKKTITGSMRNVDTSHEARSQGGNRQILQQKRFPSTSRRDRRCIIKAEGRRLILDKVFIMSTTTFLTKTNLETSQLFH